MSAWSPAHAFSDFVDYVVCVDKDAAKIKALHAGVMPIISADD